MTAHPGWPARLEAGPVLLRPPRSGDGPAWSEIRLRNQGWLRRWEPTADRPWSEQNDPAAWPPFLVGLRRAARAGTKLPFVITYDGRLVGQISASNVVHRALRSCTAGYWVDAAVAGRGIAPVALALLIDHCFAEVGLHRVEVDIQPDNAASLRVVEKLGLRCEGRFERFLHLGGAWRDHLAFAVTVEELKGGTMVSRLG